MSFRYSPTNLLGTAIINSAPTQAAGYSASAIFDGNVGVLSRSSTTGTTWTWVFDRSSAPLAVNLFAIFGLRSKALGAVNIVSVTISDSPDNITYTTRGTITLNARGDGWAALTSSARYVKLVVVFTSADTIDVGEFWGGVFTDLTRSPMGPLARGITYPTKVNDAEDGSIYTSRVADYFEDWDFHWGTLTATQGNEILTMYQGVLGALNPIVIVPDTIGGEVFHGHFTPQRLQRNVDTPVVTGLQLAFRQSGRAVYA